MQNGRQILDQQFIEMRSRCLSLAADLDRVQRAKEGAQVLQTDARVQKLHSAIAILLSPSAGRAERVLEAFSDMTPVAGK